MEKLHWSNVDFSAIEITYVEITQKIKLLFYINQKIPCKKIETFQFESSIEILKLEINIGTEKLLVFGTYKPPIMIYSSFLNELYNSSAFYKILYKNYVLLGDLNIVRNNTQLQNFCESLLFQPNCYKGMTPKSSDHIIKKRFKTFMKSMALKTGISDRH